MHCPQLLNRNYYSLFRLLPLHFFHLILTCGNFHNSAREQETYVYVERGARVSGRNSLSGSGASSAIFRPSCLTPIHWVSGDPLAIRSATGLQVPERQGSAVGVAASAASSTSCTHNSANPPLSKGTLLLTHTRTQTGNRAAVRGDFSLGPQVSKNERARTLEQESCCCSLACAFDFLNF